MPAAHRAHKEWTPERLIHWGTSIGPAAGAFVAAMLERHRHPEHGYRGCLALLGLARRYGRQRLEAACAPAIGKRLGKSPCPAIRSVSASRGGRPAMRQQLVDAAVALRG
jgi:hypothetical protein